VGRLELPVLTFLCAGLTAPRRTGLTCCPVLPELLSQRKTVTEGQMGGRGREEETSEHKEKRAEWKRGM